MKVEILTLFPELFENFLNTSLISKAISAELLDVRCTQIRDFADPPHQRVDDLPYGGGPGMVMMPGPLSKAIEDAKSRLANSTVILLSPSGERFTQSKAKELSQGEELILICGRYEGIDQRVVDLYVDKEVSIGDFVLMGGEVPAMVLIETAARLIPGVLGNEDSAATESFSEQSPLLEAPQYTRPPEFEGRGVPPVLLSGDHQKIADWRETKSLEKTRALRSDLLNKTESSDE